MENKNQKRTRTIGIVSSIVVVGILALFSALSILGKNSTKSLIQTSGGMYGAESINVDYSNEARMEMGKTTSPSAVAEDMDYEGSSVSLDVSTDKKIIKNGNLTMQVENLDDAQDKISGIANGNGGSVFSSNIYQSGKNSKRGNITVKIPVSSFEKVLEEIKEVASLVVRETTSGVDVTQEYQDLEIQIKNKQAEEQSYVKILEKAEKVEDILSVTKRISTVRGEIERLQGRLRYMNSQVEMSTINISLSEDQAVVVTDSWRPLQVAKDAVNSLVKSVQNFIDFAIVLGITFIPVAILYLVIILFLFLISRKIYQRFRKNRDIK